MQVAVSVLLHSMVTLWRRLGHAFHFHFRSGRVEESLTFG